MIIPSIDLMEGKAVQLKQGKEKILEREDVLDLALEFRKYGDIAVIDIDAAFGNGNNLGLIKKICKIADCRVGGGIRTIEKANEILGFGAKKIIIGTKANAKFLSKLPKDRIIAAVDSRDGFVVKKGWKQKTNEKPVQAVKRLGDFCSGFLLTNVNMEGLMQGIDFGEVNRIRSLTKNRLTIAGGICSIDEIKKLEEMVIDSQLGMAVYTNRISLPHAFASLLDFNRNNGLIPTVVQDENSQVLMLAFSNEESLLKTFETGKATYFSRSRGKVWSKGETSGNYQKILRVRFDCDRDALLFTVVQKNFACHSGAYSCFGGKEFDFEEIYDAVKNRIINPKKGSYTSKISANENLIKDKIREEAQEVLNYTDEANLVWEISDLLYFIMVLMAKKEISLLDIKNELWKRRK